MIKAIFFDIDGTLLSSNGRVSKSTKEAIKKAQANGVLCGVSSGRGPSSLKRIVRDLDFDMFVTYNGQYVYTNDRVIYARSFDQMALAEIVSFANDKSRQLVFGAQQRIDGSLTMRIGDSAIVRRLIRFVPRRFPIRRVKLLLQKYSPNRRKNRYSNLAILNEPIYQCMMFGAEYETQKLIEALPHSDLQRSNPYTVDIVPKGGSKVRGIQFFLADTGINLSETMAFGDHLNDIEMLKVVGIGVAMGNGQEETKASADYITDSHDADGIEKALRYYKIID
ncbi:Cof-type HAD-IIB family hydrolase [Enterococcus lemanii]|jgi:Cof subfamily protein (haloacid dehalogenase superfamily)|uniref:Cof-type HAD-IIB family hydrolase n=1 Tax=Enterococcus lemanii TaxID=1159752 RepID=A0ABV9MWW0_9ENTE|nr:Cof-type HAD-IIB family hydrolase [Enterococcus lemanii]MBM7709715.1 Cof subfamily protein (haloacid dehalogenase superfamily) [Enterococcus lemanii]NLM66227.1 Cof-type HAD-IIB family hydrolase [Enterococcus sp.]